MASTSGREQRTGGTQQAGAGQPQRQGGAGSLTGAAQQLASTTAQKAEQAWDTASRQAQQFATAAGDTVGEFRRFAGRYPLAVFLAGLGAGFLLARALDRWPEDMTRRMSEASAR